jgi:GNAT superfamily N-acetyltransferase
LIGCFLAEKLVGIIGVKNNNNHLIIRHISVLEEFQQTGIRTRLINYVIDHFKPNKILAETDQCELQLLI